MKKLSILTAILTMMVFGFGSLALQNGYDLFQKALTKEHAEGNLEEAIALYHKVIEESKDESLAAKAQLRIGICYEKLGKQEAEKAYQKVIDNYPQQLDSVNVAKKKLSNLIRIQGVAKKDFKELNIRKIWNSPKLGRGNLGEVSPDGRYLSLSDLGGRIAAYEFATHKIHYITSKFFTEKKKGTSEKSAETFIKGDFPVWSPDGKLLAFNKGWSPVLMVVPSDGGEAREVWRMKEKGEQISTIAWMPDGKELIFASYQLPYREKDEMWKIGIEGGEPQKLGLSMERINWLSVHPAGNQIVFSSIQRIKDVWMMENFLPAEDKGSKGGQK